MQTIATYEGIIKNGQIRLNSSVALPENAKVFVMLPDREMPNTVHIYSPRLVNSAQAQDFVKEIIEDATNHYVCTF